MYVVFCIGPAGELVSDPFTWILFVNGTNFSRQDLPICSSSRIMESLLYSAETMPFFSSLPKPFFNPILRRPNLPLVVHRRSFSVAAVQMNSKEAKLWGGRFEENVTDAVEKFTESISFDKALYKHDIMGSRAHASMLAHQVPIVYGYFPRFNFTLTNLQVFVNCFLSLVV